MSWKDWCQKSFLKIWGERTVGRLCFIIAAVLNTVNCSSMLNTSPRLERYDLLDWRILTGVMTVNGWGGGGGNCLNAQGGNRQFVGMSSLSNWRGTNWKNRLEVVGWTGTYMKIALHCWKHLTFLTATSPGLKLIHTRDVIVDSWMTFWNMRLRVF